MDPPISGYPNCADPASNLSEKIRGRVTSQSKHLIAALQNILSKLELTEAPGRDEKPFGELKRILRQRIQDLQNRAAIPALIAKPAKTANNAD